MSLYVDIEKKLGSFRLKVKFRSEKGVLSLMGKSGCGKSITLKCIAGIERPDRGKIVLDGLTLFDSEKNINIPPQKRNVGLLFQNYALFPNMTAIDNIRAGANKIKNKKEREDRVRSIMESFDISDLGLHYPSQLSGGQQQRVALARILISEPDCLLLDEPFSALDTHIRFIIERETANVIKDFGKTVIMVSHNIDEVFRMTDDIAIMNCGSIDDFGDKHTVTAHPETVNSALITGCTNISRAEAVDENHIFASEWGLSLRLSESDARRITEIQKTGGPLFAGIRTESIKPVDDDRADSFLMNVESAASNPFETDILLKTCEGSKAIVLKVSNDWWQQNRADRIRVHFPPDSVAILTDKRLKQ